MTKKNKKMVSLRTLVAMALTTLALGVVGLSVVAVEPAHATFPGQNGKIAFWASGDIYMMDPSTGSERINITNNGYAGYESNPAFSPDGTKVTFSSRQGSNTDDEIYVMNANGTEARRLTSGGGYDSDPAFSPDGSKIVFERNLQNQDDSTNAEIYSMNASDGSGLERLTNNSAIDREPAFSPDGTRIAFTSDRDGNTEIYTMNASDGSNQTNLSSTSGQDEWDTDWGVRPSGTTAPDTSFSTTPPALTKSTASFSFKAIPGPSVEASPAFQCSLDNSAWESCTSTKSYSGLSNGSHTFKVRAIDKAANVDATPATHTWTVDATKPTVSFLSPANGSSTRDRTPTIEATVRDNHTNLSKSNIKMVIDGPKADTSDAVEITTFSYSASTDRLSYTPPSNLPYGKHTVTIRAEDQAGNVQLKSWYFYIVS